MLGIVPASINRRPRFDQPAERHALPQQVFLPRELFE